MFSIIIYDIYSKILTLIKLKHLSEQILNMEYSKLLFNLIMFSFHA